MSEFSWASVRGTFKPPVYYPAGNGANDLEWGDFDEDGNVDLVASCEAANEVSLLLGNGDGFFPNVDFLVSSPLRHRWPPVTSTATDISISACPTRGMIGFYGRESVTERLCLRGVIGSGKQMGN